MKIRRHRGHHPDIEKCESPIEERLLWELNRVMRTDAIQCQVPIHGYRADFIVTQGDRRIVVEADGADWHTSPDQVKRDALRDAAMRRWGYEVIRFTGSQINADAVGCAALVSGAMERERFAPLKPLRPGQRKTKEERRTLRAKVKKWAYYSRPALPAPICTTRQSHAQIMPNTRRSTNIDW